MRRAVRQKLFRFAYMVAVNSLVAFAAVVSSPMLANAGPNTAEEGFVMGYLGKYSVKGLISKTGEGQVMLGNDSTPVLPNQAENNTESSIINPWDFTTSTEDYNKYREFADQYVTIKYYRLRIKGTSLMGDSDHFVEYMAPITEFPKRTEGCYNTQANSAKSDGTRSGRIVNLRYIGLVKTWEATIQVGLAGNKFIDMSFTDEDMYNCAAEFMKAGQRVQITYTQSYFHNPLSRETSYDIIGIEPTKIIE